VFRDRGSKVGRTPPKQFGEYKQVVIVDETWLVHCSFAGALAFVFELLGEGNVEVEEGQTAQLTVPELLTGSWIGTGGCVVGFLKAMFGVERVTIIGDPDWERR